MSKKGRAPGSRTGQSSAAFGGGSSAFGSGLGSASPLSYVSEPLDLSAIYDASVVVSFKNLSKKDENTKARALEDLARVVEACGDAELEDAVISAWAQSYPRLSVDISRRVRQLSHTLHASICSVSKKRIAKYMPQVIGPWLAGTYDNDTTVAKSARSAFAQTFTADKIKKVWEFYHSAILEYCINIIENEQVYTLSDERQTSPDDAEGKFSRVIAACISSIRHILIDVPNETISKEDASYTEFFSNPEFWKFSHNPDPYLRKAVYKLIASCITTHKGYIEQNLEYVTQYIIIESSTVSQLGSALEYLDALIITTETYPDAWSLETGKKKKKSPKVILRKLISKGSQGGQSDFWIKLNHLIQIIPEEALPSEPQDVVDFLSSYVSGINGPQEPRTNAIMSWTSYFGACQRILSLETTSEDTKQQIISSRVLPVYEEYLQQEGKFELRVQGELAKTICVNGLLKLSPEKNTAFSPTPEKHAEVFRALFDSLWNKLDNFVLTELKNEENYTNKAEGLPIGERWIELISELYNVLPEDGQSYRKLRDSNQALLELEITILKGRKDNTTAIALLFERTLSMTPKSIWSDVQLYSTIEDFFSVQLPNLNSSPSASQLFSALLQWFTIADSTETVEALWTGNIEALLSAPESIKEPVLSAVFTKINPDLRGKVPIVPALTAYVTEKARKAIEEEDDDSWKFTKAALKTQGIIIPSTFATTVLELISPSIRAIRPDEVESSKLLPYLEYIANNNLYELLSHAKETSGNALLHHLLLLEGLTSATDPSIVTRINQSISKGLELPEFREDALSLSTSVARMILDSVRNYAEERLPIEYLVSKATDLLGPSSGEIRRTLVGALSFPNETWPFYPNGKLPMSEFLELTPGPNVDLINSLSGCVYLVEDEGVIPRELSHSDDLGFGEVLRIGFYTFKLLQNQIYRDSLDKSNLVLLFAKLLIVAEVVKDHSTSAWLADISMEAESSQFILDVQSLISQHLKSDGAFFSDKGHTATDILGQTLIEWSKGRTPFAFYSGRVVYWFLSELVEFHGCSQSSAEGLIENLSPRNNTDVFLVAAFILGLSRPLAGSSVIEKLRNALVSDICGISIESIPTKPINSSGVPGTYPPKLVILNSLLSFDETAPLPPQKAMFLLRNVLTWFDLDEAPEDDTSETVNEALVSESAKLLRTLVPIIKDVYGSHWNSLCKFVSFGLKNSSTMSPMTYWSIKLFESLRANYSGAENDDFEEAYLESKPEFDSLLIRLFENSIDHAGDRTEAICYDLLCRQIRQIPVESFSSMGDIYPLLRSISKSVQESAFDILHQFIPSQQEEISIEAALAKDDSELEVFLAPELLSLVLETPTVEKLEDLIHDDQGAQGSGSSFEGSIRGYFLAWRLIYDHFDKATFKVKSAYTSQLQEGGYTDSLLTLTFDFLGINVGQAYEPIRESIRSYPIVEEDWTSDKSIKQLFTHLYYLCLRYTPSLAKSWWHTQKNRQVITGVETLTEKFLSPLIIDAELDSVSKWASDQAAERGGAASTTPQLQVKISKSVREATASYPVDDQTLSMVIRLPAPFPLQNPTIEGTKKVGFTDVQWKSIQLSSQAVIALQGGSVIDALLLFEKNVSLHFAGVEECAICYSIVGAERSLPNKKCVTCKNGFHAVCLYKWFKSSNSSSCPLCRTGWQFYGGVAH